MKKLKLNILLVCVILGLFAASCSNNLTRDDINPFQKKAEVTIVNKSYQQTNNDLNAITKKYTGFVKNSTFNMVDKTVGTAEFEIQVPYKFFYDYMNALRTKFGNDIKTEQIISEESLAREYFTNKEDIKTKKANWVKVKEVMDKNADLDQRILAKAEYERLEREIDQLSQNNLSLIESLNYSTIQISWREDEAEKPPTRDTIMMPAEFPQTGLQPPQPPPPPVRDIMFQNYGQEETFQLNDPVKISFQGLDAGKTDLISKLDLAEGIVTLKATRLDQRDKISFDHKCQIYYIGLGPIPEITCGEGISTDQVIITPVVDDFCNVTGYELRAGTIESGCTQGRHNYYRLKKCQQVDNPDFSQEGFRQPPPKKMKTIKMRRIPLPDRDIFYNLP